MSFALLVAGTTHETPQQVVTRYNNYKAICNGIGFQNVRCKGNAYNNISGIFTAPLDGIYSFTWTMLTKSGKYFVTEIVLNGQKVALNHTDGRGHDGYPMSTSHANIKMKKGDKVWIRTHNTNGQYAHGGWCYFSGAKL
uniref:C1q domain-containing protein n=1 Tax=Magallana gigas TaxID=29159 RepID=A0A8W8LPQ9_MAGGI